MKMPSAPRSFIKSVRSQAARIIYQSVEWLRNVVGVLLGRKLQSSRLRRSDSASPFGDDLILNRKTLILDLDGTLVHATPHTPTTPFPTYDFCLDVKVKDKYHLFYVYKRPYLDEFLKEVEKLFDVAIYTTGTQEYAEPVITRLDPRGKFRCFYRRDCILGADGRFLKDVELLGFDPKLTVMVDNLPKYVYNQDIVIPIPEFDESSGDDALLNLLPILKGFASVSDVRNITQLSSVLY